MPNQKNIEDNPTLSKSDIATLSCLIIGCLLYMAGSFNEDFGLRVLGGLIMVGAVALMFLDDQRKRADKITMQKK